MPIIPLATTAAPTRITPGQIELTPAGQTLLNQLDKLPFGFARRFKITLRRIQACVPQHIMDIPKRAAGKGRLSCGLGRERSSA